jgi:ribonuclease HI
LHQVFTDGASKGNPGPASIGIVCYASASQTEIVFQHSEKIGKNTNNVAEWTSLIRALELLIQRNIAEVSIFMDSELVVKQFNGLYKTKHPEMQKLKNMAFSLKERFSILILKYIPREKNKMADKLANEAFEK